MRSIYLRKIVFFLLVLILFGCSANNGVSSYTDLEELKDKRIGVMTGTIYDAIVKKRFPEAEYHYFNTVTDLSSALLSHKVDAIIEDENLLNEIHRSNPEIVMIGDPVSSVYIGFAYGKNEKGNTLRKQMNEFLAKAKNDGLLDQLEEKWVNYNTDTEMIDYSLSEAVNGTLILATDSTAPPFSFIINGKIVGYEIEIAALFCEEYGYRLEIVNTNFSGIISGVQSGKSDFGVGGMGITQERSKNVDFSDPTFTVYGKMAVLDKGVKENNSFFKKILDSLQRTFVVENRWIMFVKGIMTTLMITILSLVLGTLLGFLVYTRARRSKGLFVRIVKFFNWLIKGLPMVVLLMILYYIIFGRVSIQSFYVAVLGFTLTFACSMYGMLETGEKAVDKGQSEAAFTLGYTPGETFNKIILPQATYHFLPSYKAEIISLIKATAVVGYIAVEDVTKVGDIIRSRTYEAFFPLIMIAIMYFVMAELLSAIVNRLDLKIDPNKRDVTKIMEGIDHDD